MTGLWGVRATRDSGLGVVDQNLGFVVRGVSALVNCSFEGFRIGSLRASGPYLLIGNSRMRGVSCLCVWGGWWSQGFWVCGFMLKGV